MTRILNAEPDRYSPEATRILREVAEVDAQELDRASLIEVIGGYDVLIVRLRFQIDERVFAAGSRLRAVASATTGLDHIDLDAARAHGVRVVSLRGEREFLDAIPATAEHTWAILMALLRKVPWAMESVVLGEWDRDRFRGRELSGKVLGIVGLGRVGRQVAAFGRAFGMDVAAYEIGDLAWPEGVRRHDTLDGLLATSDVVSLHLPLDGSTAGMIGPRQLDLMQPSAVLVNTSRGALVDEAALVEALGSGGIAGAALDVVGNERSDERGSLLVPYAAAHQNLVLTPHIGGATYESMEKCEVFIAQRISEFLRGAG